MPRRWLLALALVLVARGAVAQDLPRQTEEGVEALMGLIDRCVAAGGLRVATAPETGDPYYEVADATKLRAAVVAQRDRISRPLLDALIGGWEMYEAHEEPFAIALLRAIGQETKDDRALAFATIFSARMSERHDDAPGAIAAYDGAARRFGNVGERGWQTTALHEAGRVHRDHGAFGRALDCYHRALAIRLDLYGENHWLVATTLNNIGVAYESLGDYPRAQENHRRALAIRQAILPPDDPDLAWSYYNLGHAEFLAGHFDGALANTRHALEIRRQHVGEAPGAVADTLNGLGVILSEMGRYDEATDALNEALATCDRLGRAGEAGRADTLNNIGVVHVRRGEYAEALETQRRALAIRLRRFGPRHLDVANSYNTLGSTYHDLGDLAEALRCFERAFEIRAQFLGAEHPEVARVMNNAGGVYKDMGDDVKALRFYTVALEIWRRAYGRPHPDVAYCLDNIAAIHGRRGDHAADLARHREALAMLEELHGKQHPEVAASLNGLGAACAAAGKLDEAMESYRRALAIARHNHLEGHRSVAVALTNTGQIRARRSDWDGAMRDYGEALRIARTSLGPAHPDVALILGRIASARRARGQRAEAREALREALSALRRPPADGPERPDAEDLEPLPLTVELLSLRGRLLEEDLGPTTSVERLRACADAFEAAAALLDRLRGRHPTFEEASKVQLGEDAAEIAPRLVGIRLRLFEAGHDPGDLVAAYAAAERGSARVFLEALGRSRALPVGKVGRALREQEAALSARWRRLDERVDAELGRPVEQRDPARIGPLLDERERVASQWRRLIQQMEAQHPQYTALKYPRPGTLAEARACLDTDEVALLYVAGSEVSYLIVVSRVPDPRTAGLEIHRLPPAGEITELVTAATQQPTLANADSARELGVQAYRMLLAPAAKAIRGKGLVVVPGGALGFLPFELLVEPSETARDDVVVPGQFLVERHRIRHAPSLTALHFVRLWDQARPAPPRPFWVLGDPIYEPDDRRLPAPVELSAQTRDVLERYGREQGLSLKRLLFADAEVDRLGQLMGAESGEILVGPEASEAAVKAASSSGALARHRYVHFTTHGILGLGDGTPPSLVLGLVGDPQGEDGFLRLDEVTDLTLNADLVVLSACQTGRGELYHAEGVVGLGRAFLYAGSRGVLCSLWLVDDQETPDLMADVYTGLKAGQTTPEAMRAAQLKRITAGEPPLYWAPFILIGQ